MKQQQQKQQSRSLWLQLETARELLAFVLRVLARRARSQTRLLLVPWLPWQRPEGGMR